MLSFSLAIRNVFRQKRRTVLLAAALAAGVMVITLLESFTAGMTVSLAEKVERMQGGHLFVSGTAASPSGTSIPLLRDPGAAVAIADGLGIRYSGISERSRTQAKLVFGHREASLGLDGLSADREDLSGLDMVSGVRDLPGKGGFILLPDETAERLRIVAGDLLIVKLSTATGQQDIGNLAVAGIFRQELTIGQSRAYVDIEDLNALLNLPSGSVQTLGFRLVDPNSQDEAKAALAQAFTDRGLSDTAGSSMSAMGSASGFSGFMGTMMRAEGMGMSSTIPRSSGLEPDYIDLQVSNVNDVTSQLSSLADTMNLISVGLFVVLLFIALMGLSSAYRMAMIERTPEIGTLRALGAPRSRVLKLFLAEALFVSLIGAAAGTALAFIAMPLLSFLRIQEAGPIAIFLRSGRMVFKPEALKTTVNALILAVAGMAAVFPQARKASRMNPAAALASVS